MADRGRDFRHTPNAEGRVRSHRTVDISTDDYEDPKGFVFQVAAAGDITFRGIDDDDDSTVEGLAVGGYPQVAGRAVICQVVRASSTVPAIIVGRP